MCAVAIGAKSTAVAKQYVQALNKVVREGYSTGVVPQERRSLVYASGGRSDVVQDTSYTGMFGLSVVMEEETDESGENATVDYYLDVTWKDSNYTDNTIVGQVHTSSGYTDVHWLGKKKVEEDTTIYIDPFSGELKLVKNGERIFSQWVLVGNYSSRTNAVTQVLQTYSPVEYTGYSGQFTIEATENGVFIVSGIKKVPTATGQAGIAFVNNVSYSVPAYSGGLPSGNITYYYIRHTAAEVVESGDEDEDLTDSQKQTLRDTISQCNTQITEYNTIISSYMEEIAALEKERDTQYRQITVIENDYNNSVKQEQITYEAEVNLINTQIAELDSSSDTYLADKEALEKQIVALSDQLKDNISQYQKDRDSKLELVYDKISDYNTQISSKRSSVQAEQTKVTTSTNQKNTACLTLYGVIPATSKCEIVESPITVGGQTDQYLYFYIGKVELTTTKVDVEQVYNAGNVSMYRVSTNCKGILS